MYFYIFPIFLLLMSSLALADESIEILRIKLQDQEDVVYSALIDDECYFIEDQKIDFVRDGLEKKYLLDDLYFSLNKKTIQNEKAAFSINSAKNITFYFELSRSPKTGSCRMQKIVETETDRAEFRHIELSLNTQLGAYNLNYVKVVTDKERAFRSELFPWDLQGYLPFYEGHLGVAVNTHTNIFVKNKRDFNRDNPAMEPYPLLLFRFGPFFISRDGMGMLLAPFKYFTLLGTVLLEGEPHQNPEIDKRLQSVYYGFLAKIDMLEIQYYREMRGFNYGHVWKVSLAPEFQLTRRLTFGPRVYMQRWDRDYVNYYFGLKSTEAFSKGVPYETGSTYNYGVSLNSVYKNKRFQYILTTELKKYGNEVERSPLVRTDKEVRFIAGILYQLF